MTELLYLILNDSFIPNLGLMVLYHGIEVCSSELEPYLHSIRRLKVKNFMCWAPLIEGEFGHTREAWY